MVARRIAVGRYLSVDHMDAIYQMFKNINQELEAKGYAAATLADNTVTYGISPAAILDKMNAVERNIQAVNSVTDWINPYYALFEWKYNTDNKKAQVERWFNYLDFAYDVLMGGTKASQYLVDADGKYIVDKYGNYILVYKEETNG